MKLSRFALAALLATGQACAAPGADAPGADMQLTSDLNSMSVDVCVSTPDTPGDVLYPGSGPDTKIIVDIRKGKKCPAPASVSRKSGVMDGIIVAVQSAGFVRIPAGTPFAQRDFGNKMAGGVGSARFGLTLDRSSGTLNCVVSHNYHPGNGESQPSVWEGVVLAPGQSVDAGDVGYCKLTDGGNAATIMGNCDTTSGGDADSCVPTTATVRITDVVAPCSVTVRIERSIGGVMRNAQPKPTSREFNLCS